MITIVTGVPRSGTSLMMQMLRAGGHPILTDEVRGPDADNPQGYLEYEPAKALRRDASWLACAEGRAVKLVHALVPDLPDRFAYRLIAMRRDLREVLASQRRMLERRGLPADELPDERMAAVLAAQLARVDRWAERRGAPLLHVHYAAVLADPPAEAARVARFLATPLDEAAMAACVIGRR